MVKGVIFSSPGSVLIDSISGRPLGSFDENGCLRLEEVAKTLIEKTLARIRDSYGVFYRVGIAIDKAYTGKEMVFTLDGKKKKPVTDKRGMCFVLPSGKHRLTVNADGVKKDFVFSVQDDDTQLDVTVGDEK